jgi:hypothetical protein
MKYLRIIPIFSGLLFIGTASSQVTPIPANHKNRESVSYDQSEESLRKAFPSLLMLKTGRAFVAYENREAKLVNRKRCDLDASHPLFVNDELEADDILVMQMKIGEKDRQIFYILFSEGPSADPGFYFIKTDRPNEVWADMPGTALALYGNGVAYVSNRCNNMFTKRTKYLFSDTGIMEVHQPYFYVGLSTHTLAPLTLFDSPKENQIIAQLPKGTPVEVLLTDDARDERRRTCFLIKTPFGLLGWAWIPETQYKAETIEGISFWGD